MVEGIAPSVNVGWTPVRSRRGESPTHNNYQARQGRYRLFWSIVSVSTKALWYIESHLSGELSLEAIAGVVGVSRFHLSRVFAVSTGSSLAGYVLVHPRRSVSLGGHLSVERADAGGTNCRQFGSRALALELEPKFGCAMSADDSATAREPHLRDTDVPTIPS